MDQQRVVARNRDVIQKDRSVGRAPDADALVIDGETLARASASRADQEGSAGTIDLLVDVHGRVLTGLVDFVGHGRRIVPALGSPEEGTALLAVIRSLG